MKLSVLQGVIPKNSLFTQVIVDKLVWKTCSILKPMNIVAERKVLFHARKFLKCKNILFIPLSAILLLFGVRGFLRNGRCSKRGFRSVNSHISPFLWPSKGLYPGLLSPSHSVHYTMLSLSSILKEGKISSGMYSLMISCNPMQSAIP